MRHLLAFIAMAGVALSSPAFAQDNPSDDTPAAEEATPAAETDEASDEAAPADEAEGSGASDEEAPSDEAGEAEEGDDTPAAEGSDEVKVPETDEEAVETALSLLDAVQAGQWTLAAGLFLTLLVYGVNRFALKDKVGEKVIPWLAAGVGMAGSVGVGLASGDPVVEALVAGVIAAVMAVGGWEAVFKHLTAGEVDDPEAEKPTS